MTAADTQFVVVEDKENHKNLCSEIKMQQQQQQQPDTVTSRIQLVEIGEKLLQNHGAKFENDKLCSGGEAVKAGAETRR